MDDFQKIIPQRAKSSHKNGMNFFDICPFWARALWDDFGAKTGPDAVRLGLKCPAQGILERGDLWDDFVPTNPPENHPTLWDEFGPDPQIIPLLFSSMQKGQQPRSNSQGRPLSNTRAKQRKKNNNKCKNKKKQKNNRKEKTELN